MVMPEIFIINLKKEIKRKKHMQNQCARLGLKYQFIEAVNGHDLNEDEVKKEYSSVQALKNSERELGRGEIGCALSHKKIYQKMVDENITEAIILENDVTFDRRLVDFFEFKQQFPSNAELVLLGYWYVNVKNVKTLISFRNRLTVSKSTKLVRFTQNMHGAYGYFITLQGANRLLHSLNQKIKMPIDHYTGDEKYVNLYGVYPPVVRLSSSFDIDTDLQKEREQTRKKFRKRNIRSEIKRILQHLKLLKIIRCILFPYTKIKNDIIHFQKRIKKPNEYK